MTILKQFEPNEKYKFSYEKFEKVFRLYSKEKVSKTTEKIFREFEGLEVIPETNFYGYIVKKDGANFSGIMAHWCEKVVKLGQVSWI